MRNEGGRIDERCNADPKTPCRSALELQCIMLRVVKADEVQRPMQKKRAPGKVRSSGCLAKVAPASSSNLTSSSTRTLPSSRYDSTSITNRKLQVQVTSQILSIFKGVNLQRCM